LDSQHLALVDSAETTETISFPNKETIETKGWKAAQ
jgi:hypothetical protein